MDKELLARKLYTERVSALLGDQDLDEALLVEMWQNKACLLVTSLCSETFMNGGFSA